MTSLSNTYSSTFKPHSHAFYEANICIFSLLLCCWLDTNLCRMLERNRLKWKRSFKETFFDIHRQFMFFQHLSEHVDIHVTYLHRCVFWLGVSFECSYPLVQIFKLVKQQLKNQYLRYCKSCQMMMFLHRTNIWPAGEDSKQKVATCFYQIFHDNEHFSNNILTAKSARQPVVGGMFPNFWSPPPCPDNHNSFFSSIVLFFVCFFQIAT